MDIFVIMPFREDFDDVYHIIKDSANQVARDRAVEISTLRADEIAEPGRISLQVTESIRAADLVIADITGNNPNVMYELGYAHALEKSVVLLTQSVHESPFDVKDFRQVTYERSKLLRDCRPRLISAITSVLGSDLSKTAAKAGDGTTGDVTEPSDSSTVRRPGAKLVAELQEVHLELELANHTGNVSQVVKLGKRLRAIIDSVTVVGRVDEDDARNTAGIVGNCAVELEKAEEFDLAETIFARAMTLFPDYEGLRIQYADFLFDRGREDDAKLELRKARELKPSDPRIERLELKFRRQGNRVSADDAASMKKMFVDNPGDKEAAVSYLLYLQNSGASADLFTEMCKLWEDSLTGSEKLIAKRALADFLAARDDVSAIPIFEEIVASADIDDESLAGALHNLATMCARKSDVVNAMRHWRRAYGIRPHEPTIKAALSQYLARQKDFERAKRVLRGEPID